MMGETTVREEDLLMVPGDWWPFPLCGFAEDMINKSVAGGERGRNGTRCAYHFRSPFVHSSRTLLGTGQSSHTDIWGNAGTHLKNSHVGSFTPSVDTTQAAPEAVEVIFPA